ncbi:MAG: NAD(P)/FAD-dependent oxidoreductase [Eubacteriales bacterium]|nr:NAD(P)/FAD-dependent oxidoreductase [Eubacteriales bacterium]
MKYDLIIMGGGVAGCSAAITARQRNLSTLVIYSGGGALAKTRRIDNYPGYPQATGPELLQKLRGHAREMGAELRGQLVRRVMPTEDGFSVLADNDIYEARAVILATGTARVKFLAGEEALVGQGVSYCATCDGMFYRGGEVIVVGAHEEAVEEANYLATLAQVTYCLEKPHDTSALAENIKILAGTPQGFELRGERVALTTNQGEVTADGAFVLRPAVAMTQLIPEAAVENGAITVNRDLATSIPGIFAAGDLLGPPLQAAKAAGEGTVAALSAASYLLKAASL